MSYSDSLLNPGKRASWLKAHKSYIVAGVVVLLLSLVPCIVNAYSQRKEGDRSEDLSKKNHWDNSETGVLRSLWIGNLPPLPLDTSNAYSGDSKALLLGKKIFFDNRFSRDGSVSCSTCHIPGYSFTDRLAVAKGMGVTTRRSMPLIGVAYSPWLFWDGRKDSLWSQVLGPLENPVEHGISRTMCVHLIKNNYKKEYEEIFGLFPSIDDKTCPPVARPDPGDEVAYKAWMSMSPAKREEVTRVFVNLGKAVATYVRTIMPGASRFDRYVEALLKGDKDVMTASLSDEEVSGLRLFIGKAKCTNCHNGPLFTNNAFHNTGVPQAKGLPEDKGREDGIIKVLADEFNCLGKFSDAKTEDCPELRFIDSNTAKYAGAFKTPTLRNVADRPPYMHAGQFRTLKEVLVFYNNVMPGGRISHELEHRTLSEEELRMIESFLRTLSAPVRSAN